MFPSQQENEKKFPLKPEWAERLERIRKRQRLSMEAFAKRIGAKKSTISKWEAGKTQRPEPYLVRELERAYGITRMWLFEGKGPEPVDKATDNEALETLKETGPAYGRKQEEWMPELLHSIAGELSDEQLKGLSEKELRAGRYESAQYLIERLKWREKKTK